MQTFGWYDDMPGFMQSHDEDNPGYTQRREFFINDGQLLDRTYYLEGNLGHPLSGTSVPCPPGM